MLTMLTQLFILHSSFQQESLLTDVTYVLPFCLCAERHSPEALLTDICTVALQFLQIRQIFCLVPVAISS